MSTQDLFSQAWLRAKKQVFRKGWLRGPERAKGGNCVEFKGAQFGYAYVSKIKPKQLSNSSKKT